MNLVDTNVWLALTMSGHEHHRTSNDWLELVETPGAVRFCRETQRSLLRLLTTTSVVAPYRDTALTNQQAWGVYQEFAADDRIGPPLSEPAGLEDVWKRFSQRSSASPKLWMDSYLAAFAVAGGMTFVTLDGAFRQFEDLDLIVIE